MAWDTKPVFFSPFLFSPLYTVSSSPVHSHFLFPRSLLSSLLIYGSKSHKSAFFLPSFYCFPFVDSIPTDTNTFILLTSPLWVQVRVTPSSSFPHSCFPFVGLRHCFRNSKIPRQSLLFLLHIAPPVPECHWTLRLLFRSVSPSVPDFKSTRATNTPSSLSASVVASSAGPLLAPSTDFSVRVPVAICCNEVCSTAFECFGVSRTRWSTRSTAVVGRGETQVLVPLSFFFSSPFWERCREIEARSLIHKTGIHRDSILQKCRQLFSLNERVCDFFCHATQYVFFLIFYVRLLINYLSASFRE